MNARMYKRFISFLFLVVVFYARNRPLFFSFFLHLHRRRGRVPYLSMSAQVKRYFPIDPHERAKDCDLSMESL